MCRALAGRIRVVTAPSKARLPWLKLARFGDTRTDKRKSLAPRREPDRDQRN